MKVLTEPKPHSTCINSIPSIHNIISEVLIQNTCPNDLIFNYIRNWTDKKWASPNHTQNENVTLLRIHINYTRGLHHKNRLFHFHEYADDYFCLVFRIAFICPPSLPNTQSGCKISKPSLFNTFVNIGNQYLHVTMMLLHKS